MSLDDLKNALGDNTLSYGVVNTSALANIMKFVSVDLRMDYNTLDYYYTIDINELLSSTMPIEELDVLKNQGWSIDKNTQRVILFLKN